MYFISHGSSKRRPRFRFGLRTLLLAFTVVAAWLGWNVFLVRMRKEFLANLPDRALAHAHRDVLPPARVVTLRMRDLQQYHDRSTVEQALDAVFLWPSKDRLDPFSNRLPYTTHEPTATRQLPWLRRWMGDKPCWFIVCYPGPAADRTRRLFPESIVYVADDPWPDPQGRGGLKGSD